MKPVAKALLTGCVVLVVLGIVAVLAGVWWLRQNKDRLLEQGKAVRAEGEAFGRSATASACVDKALETYRGGSGLMRELHARIWLGGCFETATPESALCTGVPPKSEIMRTVAWRLGECSRRGLDGDKGCTRILEELQQYCESGARR